MNRTKTIQTTKYCYFQKLYIQIIYNIKRNRDIKILRLYSPSTFLPLNRILPINDLIFQFGRRFIFRVSNKLKNYCGRCQTLSSPESYFRRAVFSCTYIISAPVQSFKKLITSEKNCLSRLNDIIDLLNDVTMCSFLSTINKRKLNL